MRDTIDMARQAGVRDDGHRFEFNLYDLKKFEELVRVSAIADERDACAYWAGIALLGADRGLANRVDQAIRARGNT
jgi:hypothetical protein